MKLSSNGNEAWRRVRNVVIKTWDFQLYPNLEPNIHSVYMQLSYQSFHILIYHRWRYKNKFARKISAGDREFIWGPWRRRCGPWLRVNIFKFVRSPGRASNFRQPGLQAWTSQKLATWTVHYDIVGRVPFDYTAFLWYSQFQMYFTGLFSKRVRG